MRIWILARRDEMHDDPVVFIIRDWRSQVVILFGAHPARGSDILMRRQRSKASAGSFPPAPGDRALRMRSSASKAGAGNAASLLAYGNGRSYGDTCLNSVGTLIDMRSMNRILGFDPLTGVIEAEAGALLSDIIALRRAARLLPAGRAGYAVRDGRRRHRQRRARQEPSSPRHVRPPCRGAFPAAFGRPSFTIARRPSNPASSRRRSAAWGLPASSSPRRSG